MKRNKNRKGFTIVELVIVIALIGILATVLVPTFGDVIEKANQAKDIQTVKNMNTALAVYSATMSEEPVGNSLIQDVDDVMDALAQAGFDTAKELTPVCKGHSFYWYKVTNQIVYVNEQKDDFDLVYPKGIAGFPTSKDATLINIADEAPDASGDEDESGKAAWDTDGDGVFEFLAIGNSFSVDALEYVYQIAQDVGIKKIVIGNLYIGGCSLNTHATNAKGDLAKYTYYFNDSGNWKTTKSYKISTAIQSGEWDFVMLQQVSGQSGLADTYNADLDYMIQYVKDNAPGAKLVWHMTWAYQQNSTHSDFAKYNKDQMTMYNAIVSAVQNKIVTNGNFDLIVPNGTAVQNSRTSVLGDTTTRDGYHMSYDYGRYLTGLMVVKTVTGLPVDGVTYRPGSVDEMGQRIAIDAVKKAADKPFMVTNSAYAMKDFDFSDYELLEMEWNLHAYWNSSGVTPDKLFTDASNSNQFIASAERLAREQLPVGSIIVVQEGWQYRPEGWGGIRPGEVQTQYVVVTDSWWGDYTLRAFNVSKIGKPALGDLLAEEMNAILKVYVPKGQ